MKANRLLPYIVIGFFVLPVLWSFNPVSYSHQPGLSVRVAPPDSNDPDTILPYPFSGNQSGGMYGETPGNITTEVEYDPINNQYIIYKKVGDTRVGIPEVLSAEDYRNRIFNEQGNDYWSTRRDQDNELQRSDANDPRSGTGLIPQIRVGNDLFGRFFGSNTIDIRPQGSAELTFGGRYQKVANPMLSQRNQSTFTFNFDQRIQMNVTGKIGEKLSLSTSYDTEATFNFENQMKVEFNGDEDDIVQKIELGNVSLPVNSSLLTGAQSLFGVKGQFQFGKTTVTTVFSEQRSESQSINVQGGGTTQDFQIWGDEYEANRHFFLGQYFRDNYENALRSVPQLNTPVNITRIEVWVTNRRSQTEDVRNIVGFMDLGETESGAYRKSGELPGYQIFPPATPSNDPFPNNNKNRLDPRVITQDISGIRDIATISSALEGQGFINSVEFTELTNARKLQPNQYTFHPQLGYISLSQPLNQDEVLAVSYQYTANGRTYQVGEFSNDGVNNPNALITKLLKSTILDIKTPIWDLMMKNIYSLSAFGVDKENFRLDVLYMNDETGVPIPFLPDGNLSDELLIRVMEMDKVNQNNDPLPDGIFDFIPGLTILTSNGRIIFPVVEPFGENLARKITDENIRDQYVFSALYDSTLFRAQEQTSKNKFLIRGQFQSASGSEISLNAFNIPRGSVTVSAGGLTLVEGQDYTVDYNMGRVTILNEAILQSGQPIKVNFENSSMFSFQQKTFAGMTFDHRFSENLNVGGSLLYLSEKPITQQVSLGDEPIRNTMWGLNATYQDEAPYLTRLVDHIPFIDTKESSNIRVQGEVAQIIPGSSRGVEINGEPTTYIDDFEAAQTETNIAGVTSWFLASTPGGQPDLFPAGDLKNTIDINNNRAKIAWYSIDPVFYSNNSRTPQTIQDDKDIISTNSQRLVKIKEIFPDKDPPQNLAQNINTFDIAYFPFERGPYNQDVEGVPGISAGIRQDGTLNDPASRWGGLQRALTINNFEQQNIEFIQFWVMSPWSDNENPQNPGGDLYFHLGNISEDVLNDGRQAFENGIPADGDLNKVDKTIWGYVPKIQPLVESFENTNNAREAQDVGLEGLNDAQERIFEPVTGDPTSNYLNRVEALHGQGSGAYQKADADPNADNFKFYRGQDLDDAEANIIQRYKSFNSPQGNSATQQIDGYPASSTNIPDKEDANRDQTLNKTEAYYQYKVSMRPQDLQIGKNFVTDIREVTVDELPNGDRSKRATWVQFKVPIFAPQKKVGPINDFRSIRFMRMVLSGFVDTTILRFAKLELVRGDWRRYKFNLAGIGEEIPSDGSDETVFAVNTVNLEENSSRAPIPYVLPPGIERQRLFGGTDLIQQNEHSLAMLVCNLKDGDGRAVFKTLNMDMRMYENLKMFAHAESSGELDDLQNGDLNLFVRLGSDFDQNYYEYELPLTVTPWGTTPQNDDVIWPGSNELDIPLSLLKEIKLERDRFIETDPDFSRQNVYQVSRNGKTISVIGSPNLSNVRTILIGVKNPKKRGVSDPDDGLAKCAEIWVNELRLTGYDNRGGYAATGNATAKLADFGNVKLSGFYSSVGFGSIDQTINERNKFSKQSYDFQSNFALGKFFGENARVRLPVFFGYSEEWKSPQFNPLDPDIEFDDAIDNISTEGAKDSLAKASQEYINRKSFNLTNVRKERKSSSRTPMPWDVENFSGNYSYSEISKRNINTEIDTRIDHRGSLTYAYQTSPKSVTPFKKVKGKQLAFIREFNFYYLPKQFSVKGDLNRSYGIGKQRNTSEFAFELPTTYDKSFTFNRDYSLNWDLAKSLKIDYSAKMNTWIDEKVGPADTQENKDTIWENLQRFGRPTQYNQNTNINWQVPINKLPFLDFTNLIASYGATYNWTTAQRQNSPNAVFYGNTIQNSAIWTLNGSVNMTTLYNKVPYFRNLKRRGAPTRPKPRMPVEPGSEEKEEKAKKSTVIGDVLKAATGVVLMVKSVNANFSKNQGTLLPGFLPRPEYFGTNFTDGNAPGWDFVFGGQVDIAQRAAANNWLLTYDTLNQAQQNQMYMRTESTDYGYSAVVEPINDLRINVRGNYSYSKIRSSFYMDTLVGPGVDFQNLNEQLTGNFSMSFMSINSAFDRSNADNEYASDVFNTFLQNRLIISERLKDQRILSDPSYNPVFNNDPDSSNYGWTGYSISSADVLIPAFRSAYGIEDVNTIEIGSQESYFNGVPIPNWNLNYSGLMRVKWFRENFSSFTLSHAYTSTYSIGSFQTNLSKQQLEVEGLDPINANGDFIPELQVNNVSITENFGPLIGINLRLKNNATFRFDYNQGRNLNLGLINNTLIETKNQGVTMGVGYIFKDVKFNLIRVGASKKAVTSNLELNFKVNITDNQSVVRQLLDDLYNVTSGSRIVIVGVSADYRLTSKITARLFYDHNVSTFKTTNAFPTTTGNGGISIRMNLGQ